MGTINNPSDQPGDDQAQAQLVTPPYSYYQQAAMYPSTYGYMSTAVASTSTTSIYPTAVIQQQQTIPVSVASSVINNPYAVYAAQLAQYQAYQQQYAVAIAATSASPVFAPKIVTTDPMIPFQQTSMIFQPTIISPGAFYPSNPPTRMTTVNASPQPQILSTTTVTPTVVSSTVNAFSSNNEKTVTEIISDKKSSFFCQTCQLVCSSSESMMKHMTGFKHKKRLEFLKNGGMKKFAKNDSTTINVSTESKKSNNRGPTMMSVILKCRICDVPCVSVDSYSSHIQGQRHNRSIGYRKKMGEQVFSNAPEILSNNVSIDLEMKIKELFGDKKPQRQVEHKIDKMKSIQTCGESSGMDSKERSESPTSKIKDSLDCKPIGQDFIEEVLNQNGKIVCFTCTLCECRFNDVNAKNLHLKGRRHRLQYKKKVDPNLIVEFIKSDMVKIEKAKLERLRQKERLMRKITHTKPYLTEDLDPFRSVEKSKEFAKIFRYNQNNVHSTSIHSSYKGQEYARSFSDYLLEHRHHTIQPSKLELEYIYQAAYLVEKAIRIVGRFIELNFLLPIPVPRIPSVQKTLLPMDTIEDMLENGENRVIPADSRLVDFIRVVRPGPLGKGLLITGEKYFQLIILSSVLPTESLLKLFERFVPKEIERLSKNSEDYPSEYHVQTESMMNETKFRITLYALNCDNGTASNESTILDDPGKILRFDCYLTCPYIRDENGEELVSNLLNREKCLQSLDDVRHFRWFKEMGIKHNFFTFTLRILRHLAKRVECWSRATLYTFEVILERILISANCCLGPASLFRHFFEFLAHGIMMTRFQGLADPCEARLLNIFDYLGKQDKEDITCSAQHLVRLVALRQLDKVLDIDSRVVYQIRMNELNIQSRPSSSTCQDDSYSYFRPKSSSPTATTPINDIKNTQQQLLELQQQKSEDDRNVSLKRKLSTDNTFEEPDLE